MMFKFIEHYFHNIYVYIHVYVDVHSIYIYRIDIYVFYI